MGIKEYKKMKNLKRFGHSVDAKEVRKFKEENPNMSNSEIGKVFGIHKNTVQLMTSKPKETPINEIRELIFKSLSQHIHEVFPAKSTYDQHIRNLLKSIYEPLGLWGQAPNPNDDCETNIGVINIFPHSENDEIGRAHV